MELAVDFFQLGIRDMGVDLGCGDVLVAENLLDRSEVRPTAEEGRRERVA